MSIGEEQALDSYIIKLEEEADEKEFLNRLNNKTNER